MGIDQQKYKKTLQTERRKEDLSGTSSESDLDSSGAVDSLGEPRNTEGLRHRK